MVVGMPEGSRRCGFHLRLGRWAPPYSEGLAGERKGVQLWVDHGSISNSVLGCPLPVFHIVE